MMILEGLTALLYFFNLYFWSQRVMASQVEKELYSMIHLIRLHHHPSILPFSCRKEPMQTHGIVQCLQNRSANVKYIYYRLQQPVWKSNTSFQRGGKLISPPFHKSISPHEWSHFIPCLFPPKPAMKASILILLQISPWPLCVMQPSFLRGKDSPQTHVLFPCFPLTFFFLVKNNVFSLGICLSSTFPDKKGHQILYKVINLSCQPKRLSQDRGKMENEMDIIFNLL